MLVPFISCLEGTSCCGMGELHGFYEDERSEEWVEKQHIKDEHLWMYGLKYAVKRAYLDAVLVFSGATFQKREHPTYNPFTFAEWLEKEGEIIVKTKSVRNNNSGHNITCFMWTPSKKFRPRYRKYYNKARELELRFNAQDLFSFY